MKNLFIILLSTVVLTGCNGLDRLLDPHNSDESHTPLVIPPANAPRVVEGKIIGDPTRFILMDGVLLTPKQLTVELFTTDGQKMSVPYSNPRLEDSVSYRTEGGMVTIELSSLVPDYTKVKITYVRD